MKVLPIRPAPVPGEPLGSYIERLAHANHYEDFQVIRLLKQSGIEHAAALSQLINGQPLVDFGAPLVPNLEIPVKDWDLHTAAFTHYARQGLAKVSRQIGVPRKMLKRLVHSDFIPGHRIQSVNGSTREVITMDAAQVESLIPDRSAYLDLKNTAKLLGLKRSRLRQFVALGILSADSRPEWGQASHWYFRKTELQSFHTRLQELSTRRAIHDPVTLRDVLQFWQLTPQELRALFTAMGSPSLPIEMPAGSVIPALVLSRSATRQWLEKQRRTTIPWVTPSQAAAELGIKEQVVYELISKNLLAADLVPGARAMLKRIPNDSLVAFQQEYVALAVLAKAANTASLHLANKLDAVPATGPRIDGSRQYFYRRADLQKQPFAASLEAASRPSFPTTTEHFTPTHGFHEQLVGGRIP